MMGDKHFIHSKANATMRGHMQDQKGHGRYGGAVELGLMWASYAVMVLCNGLFETLHLAGTTANQVANEVFVWFMPAGYAFAIWGLIYIALAVWLVRYTVTVRDIPMQGISAMAKLFAASCVLNVAWLTLFHFRLVSFAMLVLIGLWGVVMAMYRIMHDTAEAPADRIPLSLYTAWLTVALVVNATCLITRFFNGGIALLNGPSSLVIAAGVLALGFILYRAFDDVVFSAVTIWAVVGVGVHVMPVSMIAAVAMFIMAVFFSAAAVVYAVVKSPVPGIR